MHCDKKENIQYKYYINIILCILDIKRDIYVE